MLIRLKIKGFKNLYDVDVRFGPFTCIAGVNGVGKSNLFDAINFLQKLTDHTLMEAAAAIRDDAGQYGDVTALFYKSGTKKETRILFEAEMLVPKTATDNLGQTAKATTTFLRYTLEIGLRIEPHPKLGLLQINREELVHFTQGEAPKHLLFEHSGTNWRKSVVSGVRRGASFISTDTISGNTHIRVHQDQNAGNPRAFLAQSLLRTALSAATASESPTALVVKSEMQSWKLLQLEPTSLRKPDSLYSTAQLGIDGSHLPATLNRLANEAKPDSANSSLPYYPDTLGMICARLTDLIDDVRSIRVDTDHRRELLTLLVTTADGTEHPAKSLSDGTLRFLALAVLAQDPESQGLLCLEEPENGIHPARLPAMLRLLQDICTDVKHPVDQTNPLRQVIINTHSPAVVQLVPEDSLLIAQPHQTWSGNNVRSEVRFACLPNTWRTEKDPENRNIEVLPIARLLSYLNPVIKDDTHQVSDYPKPSKRVIDRDDVTQLLFPFEVQGK
jgi:predicted ATPase